MSRTRAGDHGGVIGPSQEPATAFSATHRKLLKRSRDSATSPSVSTCCCVNRPGFTGGSVA
jgi:hypothetical protein